MIRKNFMSHYEENRNSLMFLKGIIMLESKFQSQLIKEIKERLPGCIVMKTDPTYIQGIPDLLILHKNKWGTLECKKDAKASRQPNQEYYISKMNNMSFARFINPENKKEVLDELCRSLGS